MKCRLTFRIKLWGGGGGGGGGMRILINSHQLITQKLLKNTI